MVGLRVARRGRRLVDAASRWRLSPRRPSLVHIDWRKRTSAAPSKKYGVGELTLKTV